MFLVAPRLTELFEPMHESACASSVVGTKCQVTPRISVLAMKQVMSWMMPPPIASSTWSRRILFSTSRSITGMIRSIDLFSSVASIRIVVDSDRIGASASG